MKSIKLVHIACLTFGACLRTTGAGGGAQTHNRAITNRVRYQLRHAGIKVQVELAYTVWYLHSHRRSQRYLRQQMELTMESGATDGARSRNNQFGRLVLYQLNYCRIYKLDFHILKQRAEITLHFFVTAQLLFHYQLLTGSSYPSNANVGYCTVYTGINTNKQVRREHRSLKGQSFGQQ